eukprot:779457-Pelagomonas_calceolata.AAC.3
MQMLYVYTRQCPAYSECAAFKSVPLQMEKYNFQVQDRCWLPKITKHFIGLRPTMPGVCRNVARGQS